jgi:hypothetical protein
MTTEGTLGDSRDTKWNKPTVHEQILAEGKRTNALLLKLVAQNVCKEKKKTKSLTKKKK